MEMTIQVVWGFRLNTSLIPFSLFGVRFGCQLVEEDGNDDVDDVDDGNVAAADDDGFSFDIAQSEALAWAAHSYMQTPFEWETAQRVALTVRVRIKMEEMKVYVRV